MMNVKQKWWGWHKENPHFYEMFERFALALISNGHSNSSAWLVVNRIRWETAMKTTGDEYKISNDFIAYYARLFHHDHPKHEGFFRTKKLKTETQRVQDQTNQEWVDEYQEQAEKDAA